MFGIWRWFQLVPGELGGRHGHGGSDLLEGP